MKSYEKRISELEKKATTTNYCKGYSLKDVYSWEDSAEGKKAIEVLYDPQRGIQNPNDAI